MKRTARFCVSAGCLLLLIALFFGIKKSVFVARMPQACSFTFDSRCSVQLQREIGDFAHQLIDQSPCNPAAFCDVLKKNFPLIDSLQAELSVSGVFIAIQIAEPVCFINEDIIIAAPGITGSPQSYDPISLVQLPHLTCAIENIPSWPSENICSFAHLLSSNINDSYEIILGQYPELNLIDKRQPRLKFQLRSDLFNVNEMMQRAHAVTALLTERGALSGKKQRQWTADMRFVQQIILKVN